MSEGERYPWHARADSPWLRSLFCRFYRGVADVVFQFVGGNRETRVVLDDAGLPTGGDRTAPHLEVGPRLLRAELSPARRATWRLSATQTVAAGLDQWPRATDAPTRHPTPGAVPLPVGNVAGGHTRLVTLFANTSLLSCFDVELRNPRKSANRRTTHVDKMDAGIVYEMGGSAGPLEGEECESLLVQPVVSVRRFIRRRCASGTREMPTPFACLK